MFSTLGNTRDDSIEGGRNSSIPSIITKPIRIKGDLHAECDIHIEGHLEGNITSSSNVYVAPSATVLGNIKAQSVTIKGEVNGMVEADIVTIVEDGHLMGELNYKQIMVSEGGYVEGTLKCLDNMTGEVVVDIKPQEEEKIGYP